MSRPHTNFAGILAGAFITSKLTIVLILGIALAGIVTILLIPREENPQIIVPSALVRIALPGASAREVEELILTPLEGALSELRGVDHIYGSAMNSVAIATVQFKSGENREESLIKVHDRVQRFRADLPSGASEPHITAADSDDIPVVTVTLAAAAPYDDYALKRLADRMAEHLRSLEDVSAVEVHGGRDREIRIELDPESLMAHGVPLDQARNALLAGNLSVPAGDMVREGEVQNIFLDGFVESAASLERLVVGQNNGRPVYVEDIADVVDGPPVERSQVSRLSFGPGDPRFALARDDLPAVTISVAKIRGTNAVFVTRDVMERVEKMKKEFIPQDVYVVVTRDDGAKANDAVNVLLEHLGIAIVSVFVVLVLFLGWREAVIVAITVPLILSLTLTADLLWGITINRLTLFALILSLGLLVDSAIVVVENIHRHYENLNGGEKGAVAVAATDEIGNPTNLATLAVMLVFASMVLLTGMVGQFFFPVTFSVPVAMAASVVIAYIVTPWAANLWLKATDVPHHGEGGAPKNRLRRLYLSILGPLLDRRWTRVAFFGGIIVATGLAALQPSWQFIRAEGLSGPTSPFGVAMGFMLKDNKNTFNITIDNPEMTPLEETDRLVRQIENLLREDPNVVNFQSWIGRAGITDINGMTKGTSSRIGPYVADIRVNLTDKHSRAMSSIDIVRQLRPRIVELQGAFPGSVVRLVEDPPGPPLRDTLLAEIYGPREEILRSVSEHVSRAFDQTYDVVEINTSEPADVFRNRIRVDKEKAALSGVSVAQVADVLSVLFGYETIARIHVSGEKNMVPIRLKVPRRHLVDPTRLDKVFVGGVQGQGVPLSELVRVDMLPSDRPIQHKDNEQVTYVAAEMVKAPSLYAVLDLNRRLDGIDIGGGKVLGTGNLTINPEIPDTIVGYRLLWDGEMRFMLDTYRDLTIALMAALSVVYLLLVAYYQSFRVALLALAAVPLGLIGVLPGHWIVGSDFTATSMVGIIALSGVAIRNSLLIIDFIRANRLHGKDLREAVLEAGAVRLRPILLTTLAIVGGSAVMLSDPVFGGLAISLIFGTISSTTLTVFVVPVLYYVIQKTEN